MYYSFESAVFSAEFYCREKEISPNHIRYYRCSKGGAYTYDWSLEGWGDTELYLTMRKTRGWLSPQYLVGGEWRRFLKQKQKCPCCGNYLRWF